MYTTITNVVLGYAPAETKDQLLERLIKENKITFLEVKLLSEKEPIDYMQPYVYPMAPYSPTVPYVPYEPYVPYVPWGQPWTYPFQQPFYGGTCVVSDVTDYVLDCSLASGTETFIAPNNCTFTFSGCLN